MDFREKKFLPFSASSGRKKARESPPSARMPHPASPRHSPVPARPVIPVIRQQASTSTRTHGQKRWRLEARCGTMRTKRCPADPGSIVIGLNPAARQSQRGFPFLTLLFATSFLPALPTRPLLAALAYADDSQNHGENGAKRQDGLRVHGRHPLSGLPGCGEAPGSSYHARRHTGTQRFRCDGPLPLRAFGPAPPFAQQVARRAG